MDTESAAAGEPVTGVGGSAAEGPAGSAQADQAGEGQVADGAAAAELTEAPPVAREVFGDRFDAAVRYTELLATAGVRRGLIGPREVPRLWDRHVLNCAVLAELLPPGSTLCDVGSGAGLPGIPVALARPDVSVTLLEPLLRRTTFLEEVVRELGLENVTVLRGRAEEMVGKLAVDVVTARAVAPLERLAGWGLPLLRPHGQMLALKGDSAEQELAESRAGLAKLGAVEWSVISVGEGTLETSTRVVQVKAGESPGGVKAATRRAKAARAGRTAGAARGAERGRGGRRRGR
ncbi:16S rRNA (guanine(527)-N(7))-methyltransferase RsmG [Kitasatospora sp. CM 4170]|uniref:Ribosomal RNA small subunit methyltransferase G n=1 Tax=Kitasatospora aburaviensis TaxID=67265 RepID=A0ABW1F613_9ACTN|nr:16S rRNA (guanine(527)-N(7))-methyltransferase RsmG [Kitasatospora sp. CM 4170]WNM46837.1 16S rRNA (guanine(527)-N(7))-methyltransferase RsmG [Kitasatospora sp. CM 4170]